MKAAIATFQQVSGIEISHWNAGRVGEAVKMLLDGGINGRIRYASSVREMGQRLIKLSDELDDLSQKFPAVARIDAGF